MMKLEKNLYKDCAEYYDLVVDKKEIQKEVEFISRLFNKFKVKTALDVGCGTGLYLIPLKRKKFDIEGLDLSINMLKEVRKKSKTIKLHKKDMSNFKINKKYDAIICLSSTLIILPNFKIIKKTIKNLYKHLSPGGILILDLPNHLKEIKEKNNLKEHESHNTPKGKLNFTFLSYKKGNKWIEEWYGVTKRKNKVLKFKDTWEELIYSPKELESSLKKAGFNILKIHGSMKGIKFDKNKSYRRTYLCKK